jgi:DNA-binding NarL/FixJ family response regulator
VSDEPTSVLIVDDHPLFRDGLAGAFASEPDLVVVGACADGSEAVQMARELQPDVVVIDLNMPELNGVDATRRIVADSPHISVLVLTMVDEDDAVFAAVRGGARGYLLKGSGPDDVVRAVHAVARGDAVFGPGVAERMLGFFAGSPARPRPTAFPELTTRETEILELIAGGARNADIARTLFVSPKTVRNHISNIFTKLQVADRADAIARARAAGMGNDSDP